MSCTYTTSSILSKSHFTRNSTFKGRKHVRVGGNRRDPLNLNELIRKKKEATTSNDHIDMNVYGNDQPIEILLPPNIYDPLGLDITLQNNENSILSTSDNQYSTKQNIQRNMQTRNYNQQWDQFVPVARIAQFKNTY